MFTRILENNILKSEILKEQNFERKLSFIISKLFFTCKSATIKINIFNRSSKLRKSLEDTRVARWAIPAAVSQIKIIMIQMNSILLWGCDYVLLYGCRALHVWAAASVGDDAL